MEQRNYSTWYTIYNAADDSIVAIGPAKECTTRFGCTLNTFKSMISNVKRGRNHAYCVVIENLDTGAIEIYGSDNKGDQRGMHKKVMHEKAREVYFHGLNDTEIAEKIGVHTDTVRKWRRENDLLPLRRPGRPRKEVPEPA